MQSFSIGSDMEHIQVEVRDGGFLLTITDESGEAKVLLGAEQLRKLMATLGTFAEPFPGAWSRADRA